MKTKKLWFVVGIMTLALIVVAALAFIQPIRLWMPAVRP